MIKCQLCKTDDGNIQCKHDVVGTPRLDQEIIGYSEVKEDLLRLVRDSFQRSEDPNFVANLIATLIGDFGMGKSALASVFVNAINRSEYDAIYLSLIQDGVSEDELEHLDVDQLTKFKGVAIRIDARTVADKLQPGQITDYLTPFFNKIGDELGISRNISSVKEITEAILTQNEATRLFIFIDEMEGLKETQYGLNFEVFFAKFVNDLRTLVNGEGAYGVKNKLSIILCTIPNVWDEFRRREDVAGGLLTREYAEPFVLQHFTQTQSFDFVNRICSNWNNSPFTEGCLRTLHLAANGNPRLLTKLCKHVEGFLPSSNKRSPDRYDLTEVTSKALVSAVGSRSQYTYAFDTGSYTAINGYLDREYSSDHALMFRWLVAQYNEYTDDDLSGALNLPILEVQRIARELSDDEHLVLGIRIVSKGHLFDYSSLATDAIPKAMIDQNYLDKDDVELSRATGKIKLFGKLDYFSQILEGLSTNSMDNQKKIFVSFHKDDLSNLWNIPEKKAGKLGKGLLGCAHQSGQFNYRLSESARQRIFPVASQFDLPFLAKEKYYQLRTSIVDLNIEQRHTTLVAGIMKIFEALGEEAGMEVEEERTSLEYFNFTYNPLVHFNDFNNDFYPKGRFLIIDSTEAFDENNLQRRIKNCGFAVLLCTQNFGDHRLIRVDEVEEDYAPVRPALVFKINSTRMETNLLILGKSLHDDIIIESEYQPTLKRLFNELGFDQFPMIWRQTGLDSGYFLKEWQMRHGATKKDARQTLLSLIKVIPSLPMNLEKSKAVLRKELGYPAPALPTWNGIEDLEDLGFVNRIHQDYDVVLTHTEQAILESLKYVGLETSISDSHEDIIQKLNPFFINFSSSPKKESIEEYIELLREKGLMFPQSEQEVLILSNEFNNTYEEAGKEDNYGSSVKVYCDKLTRKRRERGLEGIKRNFEYLNKGFKELSKQAARHEELRRLKYCNFGILATYEDLCALIQEGESRYQKGKIRLDQIEELILDTKEEAKLILGTHDLEIEILGETDKRWELIKQNFNNLIYNFHKEGVVDDEDEILIFTEINETIGELKNTFRNLKETIKVLQLLYQRVKTLSQTASQSQYRDQISQELKRLSNQNPERRITDILRRYSEYGKDAGDKGLQNYGQRLQSIEKRIIDFLNNQENLEKLLNIKKAISRILREVEETNNNLQSTNYEFEEVKNISDIPMFLIEELKIIEKEGKTLLKKIETDLKNFTSRPDVNVDQNNNQLEQLRNQFADYQHSRETFEDELSNINHSLIGLFSPLNLLIFSSAYDASLSKFNTQLRKKTQLAYRKKSSSDTMQLLKEIISSIDKVNEFFETLILLDNWVDRLKKDLDISKYKNLTNESDAIELSKRIEQMIRKLSSPLSGEIDVLLIEIKKVKEIDQILIDKEIANLKASAEKECFEKIEEVRRIIQKFHDTLITVETELSLKLDLAQEYRDQGEYSLSVEETQQAMQVVIETLEQPVGSFASKIQLVLVLQPDLSFHEFISFYENRFGASFDEQALIVFMQLLKDNKIHGNFSI